MTGGRSPPQFCFSLSWLDSSSMAAALTFLSLFLGVLRPPRLMHGGRKPLRRSGSHGTARAWRHSTSASGSAHWAAKPETGTFGHEPALIARTCSPAKLLGFLKFVGAPRFSDARR